MIRWDYTCDAVTYLGLSTEDKSEIEEPKDGDTLLELDTKKIYVFYDDQWYEL